MKKASLFLFCGLVFSPFFAMAQISSVALHEISLQYKDSLKSIMSRYSKPMTYNADLDPFLYQMMSGNTYYNGALHNAFTIDAEDSGNQNVLSQVMMGSYLHNPVRYTRTEDAINAATARIPDQRSKRVEQPSIKVADIAKTESPKVEVGAVAPIAEKPNFWKHAANIYFQFSQSHVSANWYKGGESSITMLTGLTAEANYNDQDKVLWENKLELKIGFISSRSDSLHKFKTNNDLVRLTSKFGFRATKNWYYTVLATMDNQIFPGYKSNDPSIYSCFLSPLKLNTSIGLDFKKSKENKYEVSVALLPISMNYIYVNKTEVVKNSYPSFNGKHHDLKIGSRIQVDNKVNFTKNIRWRSMFYLFTSYKNTESMWENTLDFAVNKVLSAKIFVNSRYDDANTGHSIQLNESLSFGISYNL
ncbi:MAG: DUF3078 domain-containing protein [Bacteroidaceae bacterium]|nr:DUF3078 domain-containing protein [Bacteroidaceae bacterium]MCF0185277.1 DUF3078 domain-containing protein [Bacteroidaceae bacterium]